MAKSNKTWLQVLDQAREQGIVVEWTKNCHRKLTRPERDEAGELLNKNIVHAPSTPSDHRSMNNSIAEMRRLLDFKYQGR